MSIRLYIIGLALGLLLCPSAPLQAQSSGPSFQDTIGFLSSYLDENTCSMAAFSVGTRVKYRCRGPGGGAETFDFKDLSSSYTVTVYDIFQRIVIGCKVANCVKKSNTSRNSVIFDIRHDKGLATTKALDHIFQNIVQTAKDPFS